MGPNAIQMWIPAEFQETGPICDDLFIIIVVIITFFCVKNIKSIAGGKKKKKEITKPALSSSSFYLLCASESFSGLCLVESSDWAFLGWRHEKF